MSKFSETQPSLRGERMVSVALGVARKAHEGTLYGIGGVEPYFWHPVEVAALARSIGHGPQVVAVSLLHDTIEDTDVTIDDLVTNGFPDSVIEGVEGMTFVDNIDNHEHHVGEERRIAQIIKAMGNPVSHVGKDLDSSRNLATTLSLAWRQPSSDKLLQRKAKYISNLATLSLGLPSVDEVNEYIRSVDGPNALSFTKYDSALAHIHDKMFREYDTKMMKSRALEAQAEIDRLFSAEQA